MKDFDRKNDKRTVASPEEVRRQIELAMLCGRVNCALAGSNVWDRIPARGNCPTQAELIAWAALEVLRGMG